MAAKHQSLRSKNRRTEKISKRERARKQNFKAKDKRNEKYWIKVQKQLNNNEI